MSALPATATPLLRPRSRSCWLMLRQSGASNGVVMLKSPVAALRRVSTLPENVLQHYTIRYREAERTGEMQVASDQGLVRATACAIVDKLNSGEVTPLDLLDVLEKRIAEVDGKVNALPTLCFDRARDPRQGADEKAGRRARPARGPADPDQGPDQCRGRADHAGLADLQGQHPRALRPPGRASRRQWRRDLRQIEHAGIRRRRQHLQRGVRRDAQSLGHCRAPPPAPPAAPRSRSPPAWHGSRMAPTWAARCATPRASAASSACGRASAASRIRPPPRSTAISACRARWRAMSRISRCCSMP